MKKITLLTLLYLALSVFLKRIPVYAETTPGFSSCLNPQGTIIAQYANGTHGIAGQTNTSTGADSVYQISDQAVTQCFCADNGQGIQTNWWKISGLSQSDIQAFQAAGWIYIPAGDLWGLDQAPYLAQNTPYQCASSGTSSTTPHAVTSGPVESITMTAGNIVTQLASTGDILILYGFITTGLLLLCIGLYLKRTGK